MTLDEAYFLLEIDKSTDCDLLKEQYRWLVKFYHPDNKITGNVVEFRKIVQAYQLISKDN